ncbi:YybH family protein [Microlunatus flavus]|uniref:DUF4440 domain-containing protein n=1 Tax=Microlunatus flavus TaxID=1036181 RepID=A0A1H9IXQ6_9ACTN|nr:DUF4440 domain-containing protein [Microlunatus flavus]SEQ79309.1 conserved hypothetical protein [Microlunatus flavus]
MTTQTQPQTQTTTDVHADGAGPTGTRSPVTEPEQLHHAFLGATNAHDVDALLALYDPAGLAVQLDGGLARGEDELRTMAEGLASAIARIDGSTRKLYVAGDVALSSASWTADVVLPDGTTLRQSGTTAEVLRRQPDGTWRMLIDDPVFG